MKIQSISRSIVLVIALIATSAFADDSVQTLVSRANNATGVVENLAGPSAVADSAVPRQLLKDSVCIVSIPGYTRAGLVFGASYGAGLASCRNALGVFDTPFYVTLAGGSWGLQIGVESTDLMLVMTEKDAKDQLVGADGFKIGVEGSFAAGPLGRDFQAATNADFQETTLSYSTTRGIFAGLTLNGSKLTLDGKAQDQISSDLTIPAAMLKFQVLANALVAGL